MKIYKFKDLRDETKHSHFLQIILEKKIWCASPETLNDKDEFIFKLDYEPTTRTGVLLTKAFDRYKTTTLTSCELAVFAILQNRIEEHCTPIINSVIAKCRAEIGVASFSTINNEPDLWKEYGGDGFGACIEINIPDNLIGVIYRMVHYKTDKVFHVDSFLESVVHPETAASMYQNVLLTKSKKWEKEAELRFVGTQQNVNFILDGHINEITFGCKVPANTLEKLTRQITGHCAKNNIKITDLT